jgi:hypothetical protein
MRQKKFFLGNIFFLAFLFIFVGYVASIGKYVVKQQDIANSSYHPEEESCFSMKDERSSLETMARVEEEAVDRFFLSKVMIVDNRYVPTIHSCLFNRSGEPIFPLYIYETWSSLSYPQKPPYEVILMRYRILPEDNLLFHFGESCYIEEIKSDRDWEDARVKYNFSKELFI